MRRAKKSAVAMAGLAFAAMALALGETGAPTARATPHHVVAGHAGDGCDNWGDCWNTWSAGGGFW